jgi:hypothetical protein
VFPNPKNRAEHVREDQKLAQQIRRRSGASYRAHDFRRTAASIMAGMGVPRRVIGKILNHMEPGVTKVCDRHSYDGEKRDALIDWGARLTRILHDYFGSDLDIVWQIIQNDLAPLQTQLKMLQQKPKFFMFQFAIEIFDPPFPSSCGRKAFGGG